MSISERETKQLLAKLAELGGRANREEDVVFEGARLVIPTKMSMQDAARFLEKRIEEEERPTKFVREFPYRPWDGAYCAYRAMQRAFGMVGAKTTEIHGFFGAMDVPPRRLSVKVSPNDTVEVPWGEFTVPFLADTTIEFDSNEHPEYGTVFRIVVTGPRRYRHEIEGIFKLVEIELGERSIYRGKAFDGQEMPEFLDLSGVDPDRVTYSEEVTTQLEANLWSVLRHTQAHRELGLPLKRAVLLAGPYGTGKTLAAYLTAREAVASGWAFVYARPGRDDFARVMQTARLYQPCVVFFEDAEVIGAPGSEDQVSKILDLFDGIQAKGTSLVVVMTTNHPDRIHKGMMRPGRLDAVISIGALDAEGIERMIRAAVPADCLDTQTDFALVARACEGYMPAFVKEVADRAVRYALVRTGGVRAGLRISTEDLIHAARGLRPQFEAMVEAPEHAQSDVLATVLAKTVQRGVAELVPDPAEVPIAPMVWSPERVAAVRNGHH